MLCPIISAKKGSVHGLVEVIIAKKIPRRVSLFVNLTSTFRTSLKICIIPKKIKIIASDITTPFLMDEVIILERKTPKTIYETINETEKIRSFDHTLLFLFE